MAGPAVGFRAREGEWGPTAVQRQDTLIYRTIKNGHHLIIIPWLLQHQRSHTRSSPHATLFLGVTDVACLHFSSDALNLCIKSCVHLAKIVIYYLAYPKMLWMFAIVSIIVIIIITLKLIHKQNLSLLKYLFHLFRKVSVFSSFDLG